MGAVLVLDEVSQQNPAVPTRFRERDLAALKQSYERRSGNTEQVGCLLRGQNRVMWAIVIACPCAIAYPPSCNARYPSLGRTISAPSGPTRLARSSRCRTAAMPDRDDVSSDG